MVYSSEDWAAVGWALEDSADAARWGGLGGGLGVGVDIGASTHAGAVGCKVLYVCASEASVKVKAVAGVVQQAACRPAALGHTSRTSALPGCDAVSTCATVDSHWPPPRLQTPLGQEWTPRFGNTASPSVQACWQCRWTPTERGAVTPTSCAAETSSGGAIAVGNGDEGGTSAFTARSGLV